MTGWWRLLMAVFAVGCGESRSSDAQRDVRQRGGSGGTNVSGSGGTAGAGTPSGGMGGSAGAVVGPSDFTLPPLPEKTAADLTLTPENEDLFYRMAINAIWQFLPAFDAGSLGRAGLIEGTSPEPSPDFYPPAECADQTVTQGGFTRAACGNFIGEYKRTNDTKALTLEIRTRQVSERDFSQERRTEYVLDGATLRATEHFGIDLIAYDGSPIFWSRVQSHYEFANDLFAGTTIGAGPSWFSTPYPFELGLDVHVQSVTQSPIGIVYTSLTGFDGHFLLDTVRSDTPPTLRFKITDHAGTTRCFFGEEQPNGVYYLGDLILTDANCDGVNEGTLVVTGD